MKNVLEPFEESIGRSPREVSDIFQFPEKVKLKAEHAEESPSPTDS